MLGPGSSGPCSSPGLGGSECSEDIIVDDDEDLGHYDDADGLSSTLTWELDGAENDIMQQTMLSILGETPLSGQYLTTPTAS